MLLFQSVCIEQHDKWTVGVLSSKAGMRHNLNYLLVKSVKRLRDRMFLEKKDELSGELDKFLMCVKSNEDIIVSSEFRSYLNGRKGGEVGRLL